jgi:hypothetical protein
VEGLTSEDVIQRLGLMPLPGEGGFYRETYRGNRVNGRAVSTAIFYLLTADTYSAMHVLSQDEVYHFYRGDAVELVLVDPSGSLMIHELGPSFELGQHCQCVVPAGVWQGSRLKPGGEWALLGTTVAPGFEFSDCRLMTEADLRSPTLIPHAQRLSTLLAR